jgi:predicted ATPase
MLITHIALKNWLNFLSVDVELAERTFLIGPNASGKSNFLEAFRFLHDIAKDGGGLQKAVNDRDGVSKIRCLAARRYPDIEIEVVLRESVDGPEKWKYALAFCQEKSGHRQARIQHEKVWSNGELILDRPNEDDHKDEERLTQTHLEQINANVGFRDIVRHLQSITYLHIIPQLIQYPQAFSGPGIPEDPFGRNFLEKLARTTQKVRDSRLKKIENALRTAVPQLRDLRFVKDEFGVPHLEAEYAHWRPNAGRQRESQFSDGTLRMIGFLWSLLDGDSILLLEEPELSLNSAIVTRLPALMSRLQRTRKRQLIISTHSEDLLRDPGIRGDEVLWLIPDREGTRIVRVSDDAQLQALLMEGSSIADVALPLTAPHGIEQLEFQFIS